MEDWIRNQLSTCLDFEIPDDMIKYILSIKTSCELDDYFSSLLNYDIPQHRLFISDCKQKLFATANANKKGSSKVVSTKQNLDKKSPVSENPSSNVTGTKKKTKYVNLFTKDGKVADTIMLSGRRKCDCEATQHRLINNCLSCGRVVCEQEGSGPCLFCGELVCTEEEKKLIKSSSKKGDNVKKSLMEKGGGGTGLEEAVKHRDRLLEYDRNLEKRTTVIDDELDYFEENSVWISEEERLKLQKLKDELREEKHGSRLNRKVTIDFAGREVIDEPRSHLEDKILKEIASSVIDQNNDGSNKNCKVIHHMGDIDPGIEVEPPIFVPTGLMTKSRTTMETGVYEDKLEKKFSRVQDKELMEMQDMGRCLSMHQPWASLLTAGIKKHEGRSWYSSHRGRLWIASTAKEVDLEDVKTQENFYRVIYNDESIEFPSDYPTGCLLGCVIVQDVLSQEDYRKKYPNGESDSPYVFICTNHEVLPLRFPIRGTYKIYKLETNLHMAALRALQIGSKSSAQSN